MLHPRQPLVLQLFPHATRKGREQGGVEQGSTGLLGDRCGARSVLHPLAGRTAWGAQGAVLPQRGIGACSAAPAGRAGKGPCRPTERVGCRGARQVWARAEFNKNTELLCDAKELVFLKKSYRAQARLCAARLVTCSASILPTASPAPPPPSLNSPDLLSSSFLGSAAVGRHWLLLPPATGGVWAPASPGFVQDGLRKEPRGHLGPAGRRNRAVPEPPTAPAASAAPRVVLCGEVAAKREAPCWCSQSQHGSSLCSLQETGAGFPMAGAPFPACWQAALVWGLPP